MRKFFAAASACVAIGFAVALANADQDTANTASTGEEHPSMTQQPGTASDSSKGSGSEAMSSAANDRWKNAKTCTDASGAKYKRGQRGFSTCVEQMRKSMEQDQMSGQAGSDMPGTVDTSSSAIDSSTGSSGQ